MTSLHFFKTVGVNLLEKWPPNSPDINVIEIIWAIMGAKFDKRVPKSLVELKSNLFPVWDDLSQETINALISSVQPKLRQLLRNQGRQVHRYRNTQHHQ